MFLMNKWKLKITENIAFCAGSHTVTEQSKVKVLGGCAKNSFEEMLTIYDNVDRYAYIFIHVKKCEGTRFCRLDMIFILKVGPKIHG